METKKFTKKQWKEVSKEVGTGKVVAFPTDTVYGLGVRYDNEDALKRLKLAKVRPETKPIPMMVASLAQIEEIAYVSEDARKLIKAFMPGAFTIILKKKETVADYVTNTLPTIAIRMPKDDFVLKIMNTIERPMLVTSANISEQHSCKTGEEVLKQLNGRIDGIVMGESGSSIASTIVDASGVDIKIARSGIINEAMIEKVLKEDA